MKHLLFLFENLMNLVLMKTWVSEVQFERPSNTCLRSLRGFMFMAQDPQKEGQKAVKHKEIETMLTKQGVVLSTPNHRGMVV